MAKQSKYTQFDVTQTLVGITTEIKSKITDTKTGTTFDGVVVFDWTGRTVADALRFATQNRIIALAPMVRKNAMKYRSAKTIDSVVSAPGTRESARVVTQSDVEMYLASLTTERMDEIVAGVAAKRAAYIERNFAPTRADADTPLDDDDPNVDDGALTDDV